MTPLLFLDIDGVLNCHTWLGGSHVKAEAEKVEALFAAGDRDAAQDTHARSHLNPKLVERLDGLVVEAKCDVVLSSTWRNLFDFDDLCGWLKDKGFNGNIIGKTDRATGVWLKVKPKLSSPSPPRGIEIEHWLLSNIPMSSMPEQRIVILDDDADMSRLSPWLAKTNFHKGGLTPKSCHKALKLLNKRPPAGAAIAAKPNRLFDDPLVEQFYGKAE